MVLKNAADVMTVIYRKRNSLFKRGETEWRVEHDALVRRTPEGSETRLRWSDVRWIRLRYNPSLAKPWMHIFTMATTHGRMTVNNAHFAHIGVFQDRSAGYSSLVRAALERIEAASPQAKVHLGSTPLSFVAQIVFLAIAFLGLAVVLIVLPLPTGAPLETAVKFLVIAGSLPVTWLWIRKNRPRSGDLRQVAETLPAS